MVRWRGATLVYGQPYGGVPYGRLVFFLFLVNFLSFCDKKKFRKKFRKHFRIEKISRGILEREKNFKKKFRQIKKFKKKI